MSTSETESVLYSEAEFHLSYDASIPCVVMVWRGYHTSESFREKNEQVLALIRETRATRILCDIERFVLISSADQIWLNGDWLPRAMVAGLRFCAMVTPVYLFNQVAVQSVMDRIDERVLRVDFFDSASAARLWLHRIPDAEQAPVRTRARPRKS
jgi:hypothetical protein